MLAGLYVRTSLCPYSIVTDPTTIPAIPETYRTLPVSAWLALRLCYLLMDRGSGTPHVTLPLTPEKLRLGPLLAYGLASPDWL